MSRILGCVGIYGTLLLILAVVVILCSCEATSTIPPWDWKGEGFGDRELVTLWMEPEGYVLIQPGEKIVGVIVAHPRGENMAAGNELGWWAVRWRKQP